MSRQNQHKIEEALKASASGRAVSLIEKTLLSTGGSILNCKYEFTPTDKPFTSALPSDNSRVEGKYSELVFFARFYWPVAHISNVLAFCIYMLELERQHS
uniref:Uncharacterized protein n=1 Tax=Syphacia muris TaxID=451379 RepID=A0A0N5AZE5_9BILA